MPRGDENLEEIIRRSPRRNDGAPHPHVTAAMAGQCNCGAQITAADLYGERGEVDLGRPHRRPTARFLQYRCPLCGRTGELMVDG